MKYPIEELDISVHPLPAVIMLEVSLPTKLVDDLNTYLDEYRETAEKKSLAHTLVGQIHQGEQLLMDHKHDLLKNYYEFITNMGVMYLQAFGNITGHHLKNKMIDIDELWSVHSMKETTILYMTTALKL